MSERWFCCTSNVYARRRLGLKIPEVTYHICFQIKWFENKRNQRKAGGIWLDQSKGASLWQTVLYTSSRSKKSQYWTQFSLNYPWTKPVYLLIQSFFNGFEFDIQSVKTLVTSHVKLIVAHLLLAARFDRLWTVERDGTPGLGCCKCWKAMCSSGRVEKIAWNAIGWCSSAKRALVCAFNVMGSVRPSSVDAILRDELLNRKLQWE